jgi:hypothetical protein
MLIESLGIPRRDMAVVNLAFLKVEYLLFAKPSFIKVLYFNYIGNSKQSKARALFLRPQDVA